MPENLHDEEMCLRHLQEALNLQQKAREKLDSINPEKLSNSEAIRFLTAGASLEREARKSTSFPLLEINDSNDLCKVEEFFTPSEERKHDEY